MVTHTCTYPNTYSLTRTPKHTSTRTNKHINTLKHTQKQAFMHSHTFPQSIILNRSSCVETNAFEFSTDQSCLSSLSNKSVSGL